jgi:hypothetical protein
MDSAVLVNIAIVKEIARGRRYSRPHLDKLAIEIVRAGERAKY